MKTKLEAAVALPRVDLVLPFDPHLALQPAGAVMDDRPGAALAGLAVTDIDAVGFARRSCPQLAAVALGYPFHSVLPDFLLRHSAIFDLATDGVEGSTVAHDPDGVQTEPAKIRDVGVRCRL